MSKNKIFLPCHSSVKWSDPGEFLKAQFVIFRCQKYVKKGYMEIRKWIYLVPLKSVLGCSILHYYNHNHDKYIDTQELNKLAADVFNARIAQANLMTKTEFDSRLSSLNKKITVNKSKHLLKMNWIS